MELIGLNLTCSISVSMLRKHKKSTHSTIVLTGSQPTTTTTTTASPSNSNCKDKKDNCADYGADVCTKYAAWAEDNCKAFCKKCELTTQPSTQQAGMIIISAPLERLYSECFITTTSSNRLSGAVVG